MREQINDRIIELNQMKAKHRVEIEHLKKTYIQKGYEQAEEAFKRKEALTFQKFDEEKGELYEQLREAETLNTNSNQVIQNCFLKN